MLQEMDNYILGVAGRDNNVISCSGLDMLWSRRVISLSVPVLTDGGALRTITVMAAAEQHITAALSVIQMHNRQAPLSRPCVKAK